MMTQQEFVKKIDKPGVYIGAYADGLTKGLDIAKEFAEWVDMEHYKEQEVAKEREKYEARILAPADKILICTMGIAFLGMSQAIASDID